MIAHRAAVKARLVADAALKVHDAALVDASGLPVRATYVILFGGGPDVLDDDRLTAPQRVSSSAEYVYTVRSVAPTADGAVAVASHVITQLVGFIPTVAGRRCSPIRLTDSDEVRADNNVTPPLFYTDMEFTVNSDPT